MNIYYDVEDNCCRTYPDGDIASIDQMRELIENKNVSIVKLQQENKQLKANWNKLKEYIKTEIPEDVFIYTEWFVSILDKMQELEENKNE